MKRRLCLMIDDLSGGGAERKVLSIAGELVRQGHEAHVVLLRDRRVYPVPEGVHVHAVYPADARHMDYPGRISRSARDLGAILAGITSHHGKIDLHLSNLNPTHKIVARLDIAPVHFVIRSAMAEETRRAMRLGPVQYLRLRGAHKALRGRDLVAISRGLRDEIVAADRLRPRSIDVILNPFDIPGIREAAQETDPDIPERPFLLHVGRFTRAKRHDILFRALREVDPAYPMVCLSKQREKLLRCAARHGVRDRVIAPGFRVNPYPWMKHARLSVVSSDFEGFCNVIVESLACGTPVVSTACPHGPDEMLTGPLAKWLVPRRDPEALAARINEALTTDIDVSNPPVFEQTEISRITRQFLDLIPGDDE